MCHRSSISEAFTVRVPRGVVRRQVTGPRWAPTSALCSGSRDTAGRRVLGRTSTALAGGCGVLTPAVPVVERRLCGGKSGPDLVAGTCECEEDVVG